MRFRTILFASLLLLAGAAWAQTPSPSPFLIRLLHVNASQIKGVSECIIVYPDGRYARERVPYAFGMPEPTQVAGGTLDATQVQKLRQLLQQPALVNFAARDEIARGKDVESMTAVIPRANGRQTFTVARTDTQTIPPETAPLLDWFKGLPEANFAPPPPGVEPNGCRPAAAK